MGTGVYHFPASGRQTTISCSVSRKYYPQNMSYSLPFVLSLTTSLSIFRNEYLCFQKITKLDYKVPEGFPDTARDLVTNLLVTKGRGRRGRERGRRGRGEERRGGGDEGGRGREGGGREGEEERRGGEL